MSHAETKSSVAVPAAIVLAGIIIAGAVFLSGGAPAAPAGDAKAPAAAGNLKAVAAVTDADHVRGSKDAKVKVIEYSDIDCPFCQRFHPTVQQAKDAYGDEVAWVYRHFPLSIHPNAETKAVATECVAKLAGNDAFWKYLDAVVADPAPGRNDLSRLAVLAEQAGADKAAFQACLDKKETLADVKADTANASATGGRGTPWTVVVGPKGTVSVSGAQSLDALKAAIDSVK